MGGDQGAFAMIRILFAILFAVLSVPSFAYYAPDVNPVPAGAWDCQAFPPNGPNKDKVFNCKIGNPWNWQKFGPFYKCPAEHPSWTSDGYQCMDPPKCGASYGDKVPDLPNAYYKYATTAAGAQVTPEQIKPLSSACHNGCIVGMGFGPDGIEKSKNAVDFFYARNGNNYDRYAKGQYYNSGQTCVAGSDAPAPNSLPAPDKCGDNQSSGYINGKFSCVDKNSGTPVNIPKPGVATTATKTTTNADGSTTKTETSVSASGITTVTTTTCTGGDCVSSTTVSDGFGVGSPVSTVLGDGSSPSSGQSGPSSGPSSGQSSPSSGQSGPADALPDAPGGKDLYAKKDAKLSDKWDAFSQGLQDSAFISAAKSFFTLGGIAGTCPQWTYSVPFLKTSISFDAFCQPQIQSAMSLVGPVLMALAAWAAFKIAVM